MGTRLRPLSRAAPSGRNGRDEVEGYLSWLANERRVAVSTHRQALSALLFQYQKVLVVELPWMSDIGRPQRPRRLPAVLSVEEVSRVLGLVDERHRLFARCCTAPVCASARGSAFA